MRKFGHLSVISAGFQLRSHNRCFWYFLLLLDLFFSDVKNVDFQMWAFIFIAMLTVLPSVLLNIVSFLWWIDDVSARTSLRNTKADYSKLLLFRIVTCLLQVIHLF